MTAAIDARCTNPTTGVGTAASRDEEHEEHERADIHLPPPRSMIDSESDGRRLERRPGPYSPRVGRWWTPGPRPARRQAPGSPQPPRVSEKEQAAAEVTSSRDAFQAELERVAAEQEAEREERAQAERSAPAPGGSPASGRGRRRPGSRGVGRDERSEGARRGVRARGPIVVRGEGRRPDKRTDDGGGWKGWAGGRRRRGRARVRGPRAVRRGHRRHRRRRGRRRGRFVRDPGARGRLGAQETRGQASQGSGGAARGAAHAARRAVPEGTAAYHSGGSAGSRSAAPSRRFRVRVHRHARQAAVGGGDRRVDGGGGGGALRQPRIRRPSGEAQAAQAAQAQAQAEWAHSQAVAYAAHQHTAANVYGQHAGPMPYGPYGALAARAAGSGPPSRNRLRRPPTPTGGVPGGDSGWDTAGACGPRAGRWGGNAGGGGAGMGYGQGGNATSVAAAAARRRRRFEL